MCINIFEVAIAYIFFLFSMQTINVQTPPSKLKAINEIVTILEMMIPSLETCENLLHDGRQNEPQYISNSSGQTRGGALENVIFLPTAKLAQSGSRASKMFSSALHSTAQSLSRISTHLF